MDEELTGFERNSLNDYTKEELVQLAKKYTLYYKTAKGRGSTANYARLTKHQLISLIRNDRDYKNAQRKDLQRSGDTDYDPFDIEDDVDTVENRFFELRAGLKGTEKPEELMDEILALAEGTEVDQVLPGRHYTYIYYAATPGIKYDRHPLITCVAINEDSFVGYNYHWPMNRQYKNEYPGERVQSPIYEISYVELQTLKSIPYTRKIQL